MFEGGGGGGLSLFILLKFPLFLWLKMPESAKTCMIPPSRRMHPMVPQKQGKFNGESNFEEKRNDTKCDSYASESEETHEEVFCGIYGCDEEIFIVCPQCLTPFCFWPPKQCTFVNIIF